MEQAPDQYSVSWDVWQEKDLDNKTGNTAFWKKRNRNYLQTDIVVTVVKDLDWWPGEWNLMCDTWTGELNVPKTIPLVLA